MSGVHGPIQPIDISRNQPTDTTQKTKKSWFSHKLSIFNFSSKSEVSTEELKPDFRRTASKGESKRNSMGEGQPLEPTKEQLSSLQESKVKPETTKNDKTDQTFMQTTGKVPTKPIELKQTSDAQPPSTDNQKEKLIVEYLKKGETLYDRLLTMERELKKQDSTSPMEPQTLVRIQHEININTNSIEKLKDEVKDEAVLGRINKNISTYEKIQEVSRLKSLNNSANDKRIYNEDQKNVDKPKKTLTDDEQIGKAWKELEGIIFIMRNGQNLDVTSERARTISERFSKEVLVATLKKPKEGNEDKTLIDMIEKLNPKLHAELLLKFPKLKK